MHRKLTYLLALLLPLATVTRGHAQDVTATIQGVVHDSSNMVVSGVTITVTNADTLAMFQSTSGPAGEYVIRTLPVGAYSLTAESPGFQKFQAKGIRLEVNDVARFDVALAVGSARSARR